MEIKCINLNNIDKIITDLNKLPSNSFQVVFFPDKYINIVGEIYNKMLNKNNSIFILTGKIYCKNQDKVVQIVFNNKDYFFQIVFETDLEIAISEIKSKQNFKSLFLISDIIYDIDGQDFLFDLYSLFGFQKKYSGIIIKKERNSCYYKNQFFRNYILLIFNKKNYNFEVFKNFWNPIEEKEFIINKALPDGFSNINWINVFDFYRRKFNLRSIERIKEKVNELFLSFTNMKNINYLVKQNINTNISTEQVFTNITIHSFQFCKIVNFDKNACLKLIKKIKQNNSLFFIDPFIFFKIRQKLPLNSIFIPVDLFIVQKGSQLPFLTEGVVCNFTFR